MKSTFPPFRKNSSFVVSGAADVRQSVCLKWGGLLDNIGPFDEPAATRTDWIRSSTFTGPLKTKHNVVNTCDNV